MMSETPSTEWMTFDDVRLYEPAKASPDTSTRIAVVS